MGAKTFVGLGLALALMLALSPVIKAQATYYTTVYGYVYDEGGKPMPGVYVEIAVINSYGTYLRRGTLSQADGYYILTVDLLDPSIPVPIKFTTRGELPSPEYYPYIYGEGSFIPAETPVIIINAYAEGSVFRLEYIVPQPEPQPEPELQPEPGPELEPIAVEVDIKPETLNLKSKGKWITAHIELPDGYSAEDVDVSSIRLNGVVPVAVKHGEKAGFHAHIEDDDELMVKFDREAVQALVGVGEVTLTITGKVGGVPFEGSDTIRVIGQFR